MFLYIILHEIYMINIDPITFFKNFLYIKDADHSSPKLLFNTISQQHTCDISTDAGPLKKYLHMYRFVKY